MSICPEPVRMLRPLPLFSHGDRELSLEDGMPHPPPLSLDSFSVLPSVFCASLSRDVRVSNVLTALVSLAGSSEAVAGGELGVLAAATEALVSCCSVLEA